jgi:hypothetical protein
MPRLNKQAQALLAAAVVLAVGAYSVCDYARSGRGGSRTSQVNDIAYCLGLFNATRAVRIRYKMGDGADELVYMRSLADSYARILEKYDASGFRFGPSVNSGRLDGGSSILGAVVGAFDTGRVDMKRWTTTAEKCRDTANSATRLAEAVPVRPRSSSAAHIDSRPTDEATRLCICEGKLLSARRAGIVQAATALNDLSPAIERVRAQFKSGQSETAGADVPAVRLARERMRNDCESGRADAEVAMNQFPVDFLQQTRLFDECYELAGAYRK